MNNWVCWFLIVFYEFLYFLFGWNILFGLGIVLKIMYLMLILICWCGVGLFYFFGVDVSVF